MRNKLFVPLAALVCSVALVTAACSKDTTPAKDKDAEATTTTARESTTTTTTEALDNTVVDVITADKDLSKLGGLITAAGLDTSLAEGGPFTILAPTNAALSAVSASTLASLQQDPQGALANVLRLHVMSGTVTYDDLADDDGKCVDTLGGKVKVTVDGKGDDKVVKFGGATVDNSDPQPAGNGEIMKIDGVVTAPATDCGA